MAHNKAGARNGAKDKQVAQSMEAHAEGGGMSAKAVEGARARVPANQESEHRVDRPTQGSELQ